MGWVLCLLVVASALARWQGLDAGLRSGSETQLEGCTAPPAAGLLQEHHLDELRRQFDEQRERMKKMEQTNYVSFCRSPF